MTDDESRERFVRNLASMDDESREHLLRMEPDSELPRLFATAMLIGAHDVAGSCEVVGNSRGQF